MPDQRRTLVLASSSPSRLSVLRSAGIEPQIVVPDVDEDAEIVRLQANTAEPRPEDIVAHLAACKARAVLARHRTSIPADSIIVAADSMLLLDGELQGKPHTVEATVDRWYRQRGRSAQLVTGHSVLRDGEEPYTGVSATIVHFADATDRDIAAYAATGEPLECAGAFTLEALGGWFIDRIDGDPSSVIGLSLPLLRRAVESFGLSVTDFWNR